MGNEKAAQKTESGTLLVASDHAGFELKQLLLKKSFAGWKWEDFGPSTGDRVDYPDYAKPVAKALLERKARGERVMGVLICGSGQGMAMAANRLRGIRAALVMNEESASLSRCHNDANIICLGARLTDPVSAEKFIQIFLTTDFEGGRHTERVKKIE